jgi:hypothetical protein
VHGQSKLLKIILARHPPGRLTRRLDGRQEQSDQQPDYRNDNQQLNQCEGFLKLNRPELRI